MEGKGNGAVKAHSRRKRAWGTDTRSQEGQDRAAGKQRVRSVSGRKPESWRSAR